MLRLVNGSGSVEISSFGFLRLFLDVTCYVFEDRTMKLMTLRHCFALLRAIATRQTVHSDKIRL